MWCAIEVVGDVSQECHERRMSVHAGSQFLLLLRKETIDESTQGMRVVTIGDSGDFREFEEGHMPLRNPNGGPHDHRA